MSENKKVLFIINPFSGGGFRVAQEKQIIRACAKAHIEYSIAFTQARGHATELAKQAATEKKFQVVFAVGGDGTVNEVAQGLVHTATSMAILPKGSGNGLARHLGIPMDFKKSLALIQSNRSIAIDTFLVNEMLSVNISGIGFDGHVASLFGKDGTRGFIGYSKLVMKEFFHFQEFTTRAELDGKKINRQSFIVAIANSSQFGNNAQVAPQASVTDQLIDVSFIRKIPIYHALNFGFDLFTGRLHKSKLVDIIQAKQAHFYFQKPMAFHIDGEAHSPTQAFEVKIQPASLQMAVLDNRYKTI